jgi:hypothetical protein
MLPVKKNRTAAMRIWGYENRAKGARFFVQAEKRGTDRCFF